MIIFILSFISMLLGKRKKASFESKSCLINFQKASPFSEFSPAVSKFRVSANLSAEQFLLVAGHGSQARELRDG